MSENNQSTVSCMIGGGSGVVQQGMIAAALASRDVVAVLDDPKPELSSCLLRSFWGALTSMQHQLITLTWKWPCTKLLV